MRGDTLRDRGQSGRLGAAAKYSTERMPRHYEDLLRTALSLVRCKALPVEGGFRLGVEVDREFADWLCHHVHASICDAERCPDALADRPRHGPMSCEFACADKT